ncbi:MAG: PDZ domain-containing protein [Cellulomonadaceae bacterium]|nr:PDZ domain-containing protein [Cellulomonadaceae bacterium]
MTVIDFGEPPSNRSRVLKVSCLITAMCVMLTLVLPTGFAVRGPGPTEDTLGEQSVVVDGEKQLVPLVEIANADTYPASGELLLTTVSVGGGPVSDIYPLDVLEAWASTRRTVIPQEAVFRQGFTREQQQEESAAEMASSQELAVAAALKELNVPFTSTLKVAGTTKDSPAVDLVETGDVLTTLNGKDITDHTQLLELLSAITPGASVDLGITRDGKASTVTVTTTEAQNEDGTPRAALGILVTNSYEFPMDVTIQIEDIGGPSAGMMFALAIIDLLTPADELAGHTVAGTGTMDADGTVGPIGGIVQKMYGSSRDGARWFLAPADNCDEVVGNIPSGLRVIRVATLSEALAAITAVGEDSATDLPTCASNTNP